jgi:quinone-modifying oxidoreductase subunit QmoA
VFTLAEVEAITGGPGAYEVRIKLNPRFVNERCTCCGECEKVCEVERTNERNFDVDKTTAIYLPFSMAYPQRYVVDPKLVSDERMKKCADACPYGAIELDMKPRVVTARVGAIVWATGWKPYDARKLDNLGFGTHPNVITNVMMERYAAEDGPTGGRITRPSDGREIGKIGFVQCAGSRDEKHLPYCSAVCCLASMKQATYIRERYSEAEIHIFYIDVRSPGRLEDFYTKLQADDKVFFHRGKVGKIVAGSNGNVVLEAEDTMSGDVTHLEVEMAVLATGMVPNTTEGLLPPDVTLDEFGFIAPNGPNGVVAAGVASRPMDVGAAVQDATGAALVAMAVGGKG